MTKTLDKILANKPPVDPKMILERNKRVLQKRK